MFEKAARGKLRFNYRGFCSVEDLWDLSLEALDAIYKTLNAKNKAQNEDSLLEIKKGECDVLSLQIAIVKHIVMVRLQEQKNREDLAAKAARKQQLLAIMAEKQDADLRNLSMDDLVKLVNEL